MSVLCVRMQKEVGSTFSVPRSGREEGIIDDTALAFAIAAARGFVANLRPVEATAALAVVSFDAVRESIALLRGVAQAIGNNNRQPWSEVEKRETSK